MNKTVARQIAAAARHLADLLEQAVGGPAVTGPPGDVSVEQLAERLGRTASTVRGWCERGLFPGAYHLPASGKRDRRGRQRVGAWRVPEAGIEAFRNSGSSKQGTSAWRRTRGRAA